MRALFAVVLARSGSLPCSICGEPVSITDQWDLDHRLPLAAGGTNRLDNLAPAHARCNRAAGAAARARAVPPPPSRPW